MYRPTIPLTQVERAAPAEAGGPSKRVHAGGAQPHAARPHALGLAAGGALHGVVRELLDLAGEG